MSFTSKVKNEILYQNLNKAETISKFSAIIKNIGTINDKIRISTENESLATFIYDTIQNNYNINPKVIVRRGYNFNKNYLYILEIDGNINYLIKDFGLEDKIKDFLIDDYSLKRAYLSGVFLAVGSINDPKTARYHLEFIISDNEYANKLLELLNSFNLNSKILKRDNKSMIYIKEAEKIADFLRIISATKSLLYYEEIRIYRENKNLVNRLNNCEQANVDKTIMAASKQLKEIELIMNSDLYDNLDIKLKSLIDYRLKYPEVSLKELSEIMSKELETKITKSGLNHRFIKIKEIADKLKNNK